MDNFKKKFVEEAIDLIESLEKSLLSLEDSPNDSALVQQVFRVMHTLKGNSAMFGFDLIDAFTHEMETVYDYIRNGKLQVSREILDVTLASVDHLKELLVEDSESDPEVQLNHAELLERVRSFIKPDMESDATQESKKVAGKAEEVVSTYYIYFEPVKEIFNNGTNPLYLLDELHSCGQTLVFAHLNRVPKLKEINPELCYTYWEALVATSQDVNSINDVFIFVEGESNIDIQKVADSNLLSDERFVYDLQEMAGVKKDIGLSNVKKLVEETLRRQAQEKSNFIKKEKLISKETTISSIRVSSEKLDLLMNLVSELVTTQARLSLFAEQNGIPNLLPIAENVQKLSRQLRDIAFSIVLIPIENMLTRFQRLVRDLSNELGKEVVFITEGAETELDKTIIESLADPLMHILRNSLDHGIEDAETRISKGKPRQGRITLKAFYSGANVMIQIADDGVGIDSNLIVEKAIAKGIITPDRKLSRKEVLDMVLLPGFSTARRVTDVSGRGVGMDVVKRKIADIRGEVEIESDVDVGTIVTIKLPLTLSIIDGLLVKVGETHFIIPLSVIDKIFAVEHSKIVDTFNNVVVLDGAQVPFFYVRREFELPDNETHWEQAIVVNFEEKRVGLIVDSVVGEYQAVLKPLGKHYKEQDMISGATILGDGTVALVIDTNRIIKTFAHHEVFTVKGKADKSTKNKR